MRLTITRVQLHLDNSSHPTPSTHHPLSSLYSALRNTRISKDEYERQAHPSVDTELAAHTRIGDNCNLDQNSQGRVPHIKTQDAGGIQVYLWAVTGG